MRRPVRDQTRRAGTEARCRWVDPDASGGGRVVPCAARHRPSYAKSRPPEQWGLAARGSRVVQPWRTLDSLFMADNEDRDLTEPGGKLRLFVEAPLHEGARVEPSPQQAHYLLHVMRARPGDRITVFNGTDGEWL